METSSSKILRNIPNMLTIFRIILIIPIIILFLIDTNFKTCYSLQIDGNTINIDLKYIIIALLFIIASISDFFDGYLSRKYHWQSNFGKFWDPLADKILVNVTFVLLAIVNFTHIGFVLVFIIRDIIVDGIRMYSSSKNIVLAADKFGKLKTFFQHTDLQLVLPYLQFTRILLAASSTEKILLLRPLQTDMFEKDIRTQQITHEHSYALNLMVL